MKSCDFRDCSSRKTKMYFGIVWLCKEDFNQALNDYKFGISMAFKKNKKSKVNQELVNQYSKNEIIEFTKRLNELHGN